jgi:hypothetical protein
VNRNLVTKFAGGPWDGAILEFDSHQGVPKNLWIERHYKILEKNRFWSPKREFLFSSNCEGCYGPYTLTQAAQTPDWVTAHYLWAPAAQHCS